MSFDLAAVLKLGDLDRQLIVLRRKLDQAPAQTAPQRQRVEACKRELEQLTEKSKQSVREVKRLEGEAEAKKAQILKNEVALNTAKTNEEYQTLLKAIATHKEELSDIETQILEAYEAQDDQAAAQKKGQALLKERERDLEAARQRVATLEGELNEQVAALESQRADAAGVIDGEILSHYEKVLGKLGDKAMAHVVDEMCQGCYTKIRPNQLSLIKGRQELVTCWTCGRMLYAES